MARCKEQWKAQRRLSQAARPGAPPPGVRPSAPHWAAPLQLKAAVRAPKSVVTQVIDLTEDDEEVDEPMGDVERQKETMKESDGPTAAEETMAALGEDVESDVDEEWPSVPSGAETGEHTSGDGAQIVETEIQQALEQMQKQTQEQAHQLEVQQAEDARKIEQQVQKTEQQKEEQETRTAEQETQKVEEVEKALEEAPLAQDEAQNYQEANKAREEAQKIQEEEQQSQEGKELANDAQYEADTSMVGEQSGRISLEDSDDEMEADVDEELPNHASKQKDAAPSSPDTSKEYRVVQHESLEDGEIFEDSVEKSSMVKPQQPVMQDHYLDVEAMDGSKYTTARHMRGGKKQKKRGKKKAKRKLEAMQGISGPTGEMQPQYEYQYGQPEFERVARPRLFANAPAPGPYTFAMMSNDPRGVPVRPVFQAPGPAPFRPTNQFVGPPRPLIAPPPQQLPVPRPPPFGDSQFLRVNRQGGIQMFNGQGKPPMHRALSDPPLYGGFKYRSVPVSPSRGAAAAPSGSLSFSGNNNGGHGPVLPTSANADVSNLANKDTRSASDDFDLDSLRAAALRTKRASKISTPNSQKASGLSSPSSSSSPDLAHSKRRHSEPSSPEIDELREEILRSMQRNRQRISNKTTGNAQQLPVPSAGSDAINKPNRNSGGDSLDSNDGKNKSITDKSDGAQDKTLLSKKPDISKVQLSPDESAKEAEKESASKGATTVSTVAGHSKQAGSTYETTTPEFRPLTACSQSVVIRLSLDDFSPRKSSKDTEASAVGTTATAGQTYNDAIEEMRRQIAEREKKRTASRLAMSEANKLSKRSSSSSASSSLPSSPVETPAESVVQQEGNTVTPLKVNLPPDNVESGKDVAAPSGGDNEPTKSAVSTASENQEASTTVKLSGAALDQQTTPIATDSPPKPVLKQLEMDNSASGDASMVSSPADESEKNDKNVFVSEQPASSVSAIRDADDQLDLDAIRAEYAQCVADCEEADEHIARLSSEMEQLTKQLSLVESTS